MWYFREEKGWKQQNAAPDPDLEIRGARSSRPLDILLGPQFGLKIRMGKGGGGAGSATEIYMSIFNDIDVLH